MNIFGWKRKLPVVAVKPQEFPGPGISLDEINSLIAAVFAQEPRIDQRILSISVIAPSRVRIATGYHHGDLAAHTHFVEASKLGGEWRVTDSPSLSS